MIDLFSLLEREEKLWPFIHYGYFKLANQHQRRQAGPDALYEAESAAPWSQTLWLRDFVVFDNFHARFLF